MTREDAIRQVEQIAAVLASSEQRAALEDAARVLRGATVDAGPVDPVERAEAAARDAEALVEGKAGYVLVELAWSRAKAYALLAAMPRYFVTNTIGEVQGADVHDGYELIWRQDAVKRGIETEGVRSTTGDGLSRIYHDASRTYWLDADSGRGPEVPS